LKPSDYSSENRPPVDQDRRAIVEWTLPAEDIMSPAGNPAGFTQPAATR
jgi:hypothetical protein